MVEADTGVWMCSEDEVNKKYQLTDYGGNRRKSWWWHHGSGTEQKER